jgi:hypothetical protein
MIIHAHEGFDTDGSSFAWLNIAANAYHVQSWHIGLPLPRAAFDQIIDALKALRN